MIERIIVIAFEVIKSSRQNSSAPMTAKVAVVAGPTTSKAVRQQKIPLVGHWWGPLIPKSHRAPIHASPRRKRRIRRTDCRPHGSQPHGSASETWSSSVINCSQPPGPRTILIHFSRPCRHSPTLEVFGHTITITTPPSLLPRCSVPQSSCKGHACRVCHGCLRFVCPSFG